MFSPLGGQVALITGANQGIGVHIAIALTRESVILTLLNQTANQLSALTSAVPSATYHEGTLDNQPQRPSERSSRLHRAEIPAGRYPRE
ncbi:hypothetical protein MMC16_005252 [Acarospora aff. strigata]|nr:hypothetical protein [Acarospora aff. strigata]